MVTSLDALRGKIVPRTVPCSKIGFSLVLYYLFSGQAARKAFSSESRNLKKNPDASQSVTERVLLLAFKITRLTASAEQSGG